MKLFINKEIIPEDLKAILKQSDQFAYAQHKIKVKMYGLLNQLIIIEDVEYNYFRIYLIFLGGEEIRECEWDGAQTIKVINGYCIDR